MNWILVAIAIFAAALAPAQAQSPDPASLRSLTLVGSADANLAPPVDYMLFVVDTGGVPSVARFLSVQP